MFPLITTSLSFWTLYEFFPYKILDTWPSEELEGWVGLWPGCWQETCSPLVWNSFTPSGNTEYPLWARTSTGLWEHGDCWTGCNLHAPRTYCPGRMSAVKCTMGWLRDLRDCLDILNVHWCQEFCWLKFSHLSNEYHHRTYFIELLREVKEFSLQES